MLSHPHIIYYNYNNIKNIITILKYFLHEITMTGSNVQAPAGTVVRTRSELWNLTRERQIKEKIEYGQSLDSTDKLNPNRFET